MPSMYRTARKSNITDGSLIVVNYVLEIVIQLFQISNEDELKRSVLRVRQTNNDTFGSK